MTTSDLQALIKAAITDRHRVGPFLCVETDSGYDEWDVVCVFGVAAIEPPKETE
jgi:hypothetical protein